MKRLSLILILAVCAFTLTAQQTVRQMIVDAIVKEDYAQATRLFPQVDWKYQKTDGLTWDNYSKFIHYVYNNKNYLLDEEQMQSAYLYAASLAEDTALYLIERKDIESAGSWYDVVYSLVGKNGVFTLPKYARDRCGMINRYANYFFNNFEYYITSVNLYQEADSVWEANNLPTNDELYGIIIKNALNALDRIVSIALDSADYELVLSCCLIETKYVAFIYGGQSSEYATLLKNIEDIENLLKSQRVGNRNHGEGIDRLNEMVERGIKDESYFLALLGADDFYKTKGDTEMLLWCKNEMYQLLRDDEFRKNAKELDSEIIAALLCCNLSVPHPGGSKAPIMKEDDIKWALPIVKSVLKEDDINIFIILNNYVMAMVENGKIEEAKKLYEETRKRWDGYMAKSTNAEDKELYEDFKKIYTVQLLSYLKECDPDSYKKTLEENMKNGYWVPYTEWIYECFDHKEYDKIWPIVHDYFAKLRKDVKATLSQLSASDKEYWYFNGHSFYAADHIFAAAALSAVPDSIVGDLYDEILFQKGILLRSEQFVRDNAKNSDDPFVRQVYERNEQNKATLQSLPKTNEGQSQRYKLVRKIESDERFLAAHSSFTAKSEFSNIGWKEIQKHLKDNEVAIEFFRGNGRSFDAYLLRKSYKQPVKIHLDSLYHLGNDNDRRSTDYDRGDVDFVGYPDDIYLEENGTRLYRRLWLPLTPYINEGETVYFAADEELHQLAIEALPVYSKSVVGEHYNMVRLSSTREIANLNTEQSEKSAALYGGITYSVDVSEMAAESRNYEQTENGIDMGFATRGKSWTELKGTKREIDDIESLLTKKSIKIVKYEKAQGNEESFKALSGKNMNIIHVATHGFFMSADDIKKALYYQQQGDTAYTQYVNPLNRCALVFAGANNAWKGHTLPQGMDDGILTGQEISLIDLDGCELVVLSACETAKGVVTAEGVFGLQRAFKQAGVQTIIMSLWEANDNATRQLMTDFYANWMSGQTKRQAFRNAQSKLRKQYPDAPFIWAAFIMLD